MELGGIKVVSFSEGTNEKSQSEPVESKKDWGVRNSDGK